MVWVAVMVKEGIALHRLSVDRGMNASILVFKDGKVQKVDSVKVIFHCEF